MEKKHRKRMIECVGYRAEDKSFRRWKEVRSRKVVLRNYLVMVLCRLMPDIELKNRIYRRVGMKIGRNVSIFGSNLDIFFPELIEIGDNAVIGNNTCILAHEFLGNGWRRGRVKIGKDVVIGNMTLILPGVDIGDGSTVAAYSLVNRDVEPGSLVGGVPIKKIR